MRGRTGVFARALWLAVAMALVVGMVPAAGFAGEPARGKMVSRYEVEGSGTRGVAGPLQTMDARRTVVRWAPGVQAEQIKAAGEQIGFRVLRTSQRLGYTLVEPTRKGLTPADLAAELKRARLAVRADAEKVFSVASLPVPNDPYFSGQWALHNTGQTGGTPDADIDAPEAWAVNGSGSDDVIVAVVDTGVDISHEDLRNNIWRNPGEIAGNGRDDEGNGYVDDVNGFDFYMYDGTVYDQQDGDQHGTHVSGIIGAEGNNGIGVSGVNHDVTIMPVKFLGPGGGGEFEGAEALMYAVDNGAQVINCSWGGPYSLVIDEALQYAADHGVVVCVAAGNDMTDVDASRDSFYPASSNAETVITVASTDHNDDLSFFSNYGDETVELAAPGEEVTSTLPYDVVGVYVNDLPFKVAFLAFCAEGIVPASAGKAAVTGSLTQLGAAASTPIVIVDDSLPTEMGEVAGERLGFYTDTLAAAGYTAVTTWSTESKGTPPLSALQGKIVVWFTGAVPAGWYEANTLNMADAAVLKDYMDNGGRLLLASGEVAADVLWFDEEFMIEYMHVLPNDQATWGTALRGTAGTPFSGITGALAPEYATPYEAKWPAGSDPLYLIDEMAKPIFEMGGYGPLSGTSMATPQVTGAAAHILSVAPDADAAEIKARIENTAEPLASLEGMVNSGGRLDLARVFDTYPGRPTISAPVTGDVLRANQPSTLAWTPAFGGSTEATFDAEIGIPFSAWTEDFNDGDLAGWEISGNHSWDTTTGAYEGDYALWSGTPSPGNIGSAQTTVTVPSGGGTVSLWAKMSAAEPMMTWGSVYMDGVWIADMYETTDWTRFEATVSEGEHALWVEYYVDEFVSESSQDYFAIDNITVNGHDWEVLGSTDAGDYDLGFTAPDMDTDDLWFRVRGNLNGVSSGWAYSKNVKVSSDFVAPAAPTAFTAVAGTDGDATLSWTDPADADFAYTRVLRSLDGSPAGPDDAGAVIVYEGTGGEFYDVGLAAGTTAYYTAFAVDGDMNWSDGASADADIVDTSGPDPVAFLEASMFEGAVAVSWMNPPVWQVAGVKVLRRTDGYPTSFDDPQAAVVFDGPGAYVSDYDVMSEPDGTTAYYAVYAYDASMNISDAATVSLTIDVTPPEGYTYFIGLDSYYSDLTGQELFFAAGTVVTLGIDVADAVEMRFNQGEGWSEWEDYATEKPFTLPAIDGVNVVLGEFRDAAGNLLQTESSVYYDILAPLAPTGVAASNWNYGVRLVWDFPEDESVVGWNVFMAENEAGPWTNLTEEYAVQWPEYTAGGLTAGETYYFKVTAIDGVGHESPASEIASATPSEGVVRLSGNDRYATAIQITSEAFDTADAVVLASGADYADALGASGLAGALEAPVLLTEPGRLSAGVADEIERLGATRVVIVGGEKAVSAAVEDALDPALEVERLAGANRFETSAWIARAIATELGDEFSGEAFVANGFGYADALAAAPVAYAASMPILLVAPDSTPDVIANVAEDVGIVSTYVLGGEAAVGDEVAEDMGADPDSRLGGANRYDTAAMIADFAYGTGLNDFRVVGVATGTGFADALAGGAAIGKQGGVLLFTDPNALSAATEEALAMHAYETERVDVFGGPNAVSDDVMQQIIDVFAMGGAL